MPPYKNPYYDPYKTHHTPTGFRNVHVAERVKKRGLMYWAAHELFTPEEPFAPVTVPVDMTRIMRPDPHLAQATWIGHATFLLQYAGVNVLTDPVFSDRASPLSFLGPKRKVPPAIALKDLPPIDYVLISHNHYDHLDAKSVEGLRDAVFYVPLGLKHWVRKHGVKEAHEMDWYDTDKTMYGAADPSCVTFLPAQHFSRRMPWDGNKSLWGSWTARIGDFRFFFGGDTGYMPEFAGVGARVGEVDLALVPVGAYEPREVLAGIHATPEEAVKIAKDVGAKRVLPMHWSTFRLTIEPMAEPGARFRKAVDKAGYDAATAPVLRIGETYAFTPEKKPPGCGT
ncbi:MAG: MBL fold metallo-hydrolase [Rickettsiales bacterium]